MVQKYYGVHPASPHPIPSVVTVEPAQEGERRFDIVRAGDAPRVAIGFHVPQATHADTYSVAAIAAILGGGRKSSRLYRALVDTKLASSAHVWHFEQRDPGMIMVFATPAEGVSHETVEKAIYAELDKLAASGVDADELNRAKLSHRKQMVLAASDPMQLADAIGEAESVADWTFYTTYAEKLDAVTSEDIQRAAGPVLRQGKPHRGLLHSEAVRGSGRGSRGCSCSGGGGGSGGDCQVFVRRAHARQDARQRAEAPGPADSRHGHRGHVAQVQGWWLLRSGGQAACLFVHLEPAHLRHQIDGCPPDLGGVRRDGFGHRLPLAATSTPTAAPRSLLSISNSW